MCMCMGPEEPAWPFFAKYFCSSKHSVFILRPPLLVSPSTYHNLPIDNYFFLPPASLASNKTSYVDHMITVGQRTEWVGLRNLIAGFMTSYTQRLSHTTHQSCSDTTLHWSLGYKKGSSRFAKFGYEAGLSHTSVCEDQKGYPSYVF